MNRTEFTITDEQLNELGELADTCENLIGASELPMPPVFHVEQLRAGLHNLARAIKALVVAVGGDDPWEDPHDE